MNLISAALSKLLEDEEATRQATLQNQAAIDFLLLVHGHSCEKFEGFCCFNLSDRSQSIHASISKMKDMVHSIKEESEDWFQNTFKNWGLTGWMSSITKDILCVVLVLSTIISITKRVLLKKTVHQRSSQPQPQGRDTGLKSITSPLSPLSKN